MYKINIALKCEFLKLLNEDERTKVNTIINRHQAKQQFPSEVQISKSELQISKSLAPKKKIPKEKVPSIPKALPILLSTASDLKSYEISTQTYKFMALTELKEKKYVIKNKDRISGFENFVHLYIMIRKF